MSKLAIVPGLVWASVIAAPATAQSAAPADAAPRPIIVFFDWGKSEISRDAAASLDTVVGAYRQRSGARITLLGHSDRSGPAWHNLRSSRCRADAVRAYLADHGIPASAMIISAAGEARPIVATEDGVREGQNRRVEINFEFSRAE